MQRLLNFVLIVLLMFLGYQLFQQTDSADKISASERKSSSMESTDFSAILKAKRLRAVGKRCGYIGIDSFFGRTGNRLFLYAFAFALAKRLERRLVIPADTPLLHGVFRVTAGILNASDIERFEPIYELYEHDENFTMIGLKARLECERSYLIRRYAFSYRRNSKHISYEPSSFCNRWSCLATGSSQSFK